MIQTNMTTEDGVQHYGHIARLELDLLRHYTIVRQTI